MDNWRGDGWPRWRELAGLIEVLEGPDAVPRVPQLAGTAELSGVRKWLALIRENAVRTRVPEAWIAGVMLTESGGRPRVTSPAGAVGLMQLMPQFYGGNAGGRLFEPSLNVRLGADTLARYRNEWDLSLPEAYSCYNAGPSSAHKGPKRSPSRPFGLAHDPPAIMRTIEAHNSWVLEGPRATRTGGDGLALVVAAGIASKALGWW